MKGRVHSTGPVVTVEGFLERWRRIFAFHGAIIFVVGAIVFGVLFANVHSGGVIGDISTRRWSIAHQQGIIHALLFFGVGALIGHFRLTRRWIVVVGWTLIAGGWAAVIAAFVSAYWGVFGREWDPSPPLPPDEHTMNRIALILFAVGVVGPTIAFLVIVLRSLWEVIRVAIAPHTWKNWVKTVTIRPGRVYEPRTDGELLEAVEHAVQDRMVPIRAFGAGGTWNPLATSHGAMVDMRYLNRELKKASGDPTRITVEAGMLIEDLSELLRGRGQTLEAAPVIRWIQVGGAVAVGAHGTGIGPRHFIDHVVGMALIQVDQDNNVSLQQYDDNHADWRWLLVNLGSMGIIYSVTFRTAPMKRVKIQDTPQPMQDTIRNRLPALVDAGSGYTEIFWFPHSEDCWVKRWPEVPIGSGLEAPPWWRDIVQWVNTKVLAPLALHSISLLPWLSPAAMKLFGSIVQLETKGRVVELPDALHYQRFYAKVVSMGYAIPYDPTKEGIGFEPVKKAWFAVTDRLELLRDEGIYPLNMILHARFVDEDAGMAMLYPSTDQAFTCYIEVLSFPHTARFEEFFRAIEREWLALGGRPNWPKLHFATERIRESYPAGRVGAFLYVRDKHDPNCVFLNDYAREILGR